MKNLGFSLKINLALLFLAFPMVFSGLLMQLSYHIGNKGEIYNNDVVLGINYSGWSLVHKISIIIFSILMIYHIVLHWKWYKTVIKKNLFSKNKLVLALSAIFILTAITGYIPWLIELTGGENSIRLAFIEIHDKVALVLLVFLLLHIIKRMKWIITAIKKMIAKHSTQYIV